MTVKLSIIIPYYNERDYLLETLKSLVQQDCRDFCIILVDNASTDGSEDLARDFMGQHPDIDVKYLHNPEQGCLPTLEYGLQEVETDYVASCDADTIYPPHYVGWCLKLFEGHGNHRRGLPVVGVMAINLYAPVDDIKSRQRICKIIRKSRLFTSQCHAGGYAQAYRVDALRKAGGFRSGRWPYLLYDHEVYERVRHYGVISYHPDHYCFPSDRRGRSSVKSWTWGERMIYRFTPCPAKSWFFYNFLAKRFAQRDLAQVKLRERNF